jgi:hypothetical protein
MCEIVLLKSRKLNCIVKKVGIRSMSVITHNQLNRVVTSPAGVVTLPAYMLTATLPAGPKIARFDVKNTTSNYTDTLTINADTRSGGRKGQLPLVLVSSTGLDNIALSDIVDQITKTDAVWFMELKNGDIFAIGSEFGATVSTVADTTGGTDGDLNGVTITIDTDEDSSFRKYWLAPAAVAQLIASTLSY